MEDSSREIYSSMSSLSHSLSLFHRKLLGRNIETLLPRSTNPSLSAMMVVLSNNVENNLLGLVKDLLLRFSVIDSDEVPTVRGYIQG